MISMNAIKVLLIVFAITIIEVRAADDPPTVWGADVVLKRCRITASTQVGYLAAATFLREKLVADNVYPNIRKQCLAFELEDIKGEVFYFAAKVDQSICGPPSASNLLDRYRVNMRRKLIYLYDSANNSYSLVRDKE
jgi:hypothetical protein